MSRKGRSFNDLQLAGEVRNLALKQVKRVLLGIDYKLKVLDDDPSIDVAISSYEMSILEKMASTALPRLSEVTGPDGGAIEIKGVDISFRE